MLSFFGVDLPEHVLGLLLQESMMAIFESKANINFDSWFSFILHRDLSSAVSMTHFGFWPAVSDAEEFKHCRAKE